MSAPKDEVRRLLAEPPEGASFEDIQYHIYVREKIQAGLDDVEAGRILSEQEVENRLSKWLEP